MHWLFEEGGVVVLAILLFAIFCLAYLGLWLVMGRGNECSHCGNRDLPPSTYLHNGQEVSLPCSRCGFTGTED